MRKIFIYVALIVIISFMAITLFLMYKTFFNYE